MQKTEEKGAALADDLLEFLVQVAKIKDPRKLQRIDDEIGRAKLNGSRPIRNR